MVKFFLSRPVFLAVRFSIYSAVWIRPYVQVRFEMGLWRFQNFFDVDLLGFSKICLLLFQTFRQHWLLAPSNRRRPISAVLPYLATFYTNFLPKFPFGYLAFMATVVYNWFFAESVRQNDTDMTSLCMQFEKEGRGLLREDFWREGKCVVSQKRGGKIRKDW